MMLDDLMSDFLALRKLYGLLSNSADVKTKKLDEKVQKLLKELLDAALERCFTEYLKLIATQLDNCKASASDQLVQAIAATECLVSSDVQMPSSKIMGFHKGLGSRTLSSKKDEGLLSQKAPSEFNLESVPKPDNFKRRCLACQRNRKMQQILATEDIPAPNISQNEWVQSKEFQLSDRDAKCAMEKNLNRSGSMRSNQGLSLETKLNDNKHMMKTFCLVSSHTTSPATQVSKLQGRSGYDFPSQMKKQPDISDQFARDVDDAIKRIEAYILSMQLSSQRMDPLKNDASQNGLYKLDSSAPSIILPKQQARLKGNTGQVGELIRRELPLWQMSEQNHMSANSSKVYETLSCSPKTSRLDEAPFMRSSKVEKHIINSGYGSNEAWSIVNINGKDAGTVTPNHGLSCVNKPHPVNSLMATAYKLETLSPLTNRDYGTSHTKNMVHGLRVPLITEHSKRTPRKVEKPPFAFPSRPVNSVSSIYSGNKDTRESKAPHNVTGRPTLSDQWSFNKKVPLHNRNLGGRRTCRAHVGHGKEMRSSEIESEYGSSSPYTSYSSWSSEDSGTIGSYNKAFSTSYSNYSEASISSECKTSFVESLFSYSTSSNEQSISSKRVGQIRRQASQHKKIGRFKRMKNKLGLIFHHHHHHHHDGPFNSYRTAITHHGTSMWKHVQNIFHHKRGSKKNKARVVDKRRKSVNTSGRHFHKLVQGFLRHVRRTKIAKPIKRNGFKTKNKKVRWWEMQRRNGGIKLPNRRKV